MIQKLPGGARQTKSGGRKSGFGSARKKIQFARGCVSPVFPDQFVCKGKSVAGKFKPAWDFLRYMQMSWQQVKAALPN